jgi:geranylgeranyl pyrophosphate synthase
MFLAPVQEGINKVEALMRSQANDHHPDLRAAMDLLISAGGKRIRPTITLLSGKMLGAPDDRLITLAAAIELLHTATLVHDDLIDGSLLRRGIPTLNSKWTPAATVLTGDFIFARAAKLAADTGSVALMKVFATTLSTIVNGEITQLFTSHCQVNRDDYNRRIYAKTASLFETSATTAAILSQAPQKTIDDLCHYGYCIGMAFQIIDDILDFTGEQATVGKPVGSDLQQGIVTLPTIIYIEMNPKDGDGTRLRSGQCLNEDHATRMAEAIRDSPAIKKAHAEAQQYIQQGIDYLSNCSDTPERRSLEEIAEFIVQRSL